jgi:hypothetical protein
MSHPKVIFWPNVENNVATIAPLQVVGDDLTVQINSNQPNMPNVPVNNSGVYIYQDMLRTVSITSPNDLSAISFFIMGLSSPLDENGNPVLSTVELDTETILVGPNNGTVLTTRVYQQIYSITTDIATGTDQVSVGFGSGGITAYTFLNLNSSAPQAVQLQGQVVNGNDNFNYQFYASMTKPEIINTNYGTVTPFPQPIPAFPVGTLNTNVNIQVPLVGPQAIIWAQISDATNPASDSVTSFYFTIIEQGITR